MVWQPNILNNCYELSGGYAPSEPPTRGSAPGPRWGTSVPQTPCAPTSESWLRLCVSQQEALRPQTDCVTHCVNRNLVKVLLHNCSDKWYNKSQCSSSITLDGRVINYVRPSTTRVGRECRQKLDRRESC